MMRFLFVCVRCGHADGPAVDSSPTTTSPPTEDSGSLFSSSSSVGGGGGGLHRTASRKRRKSAGKGGGAEWKPSLNAISEDYSTPTAPPASVRNSDRCLTAGSGKSGGKRCVVSSTAPRSRGRSTSESYGHEALPMILPAFGPTPFMF